MANVTACATVRTASCVHKDTHNVLAYIRAFMFSLIYVVLRLPWFGDSSVL